MNILARIRSLAFFVRRFLRLVVVVLPFYFLGTCAALFKLHFVDHYDLPRLFWIREPLGFVISCFITFELFHVERFRREPQ